MKTLKNKTNSKTNRINENRLNYLIDSKLKNIDKMIKADMVMDKIRNSYITDENWNSVEIIRKFREKK